VNRWAQNEPKMPEDFKLHIKRMYRSWKIANASFLEKLGMILKYLIFDFKSIRSGLYNINFRSHLLG
jgi:hypothetical protein